jgi:hypothetical protein
MNPVVVEMRRDREGGRRRTRGRRMVPHFPRRLALGVELLQRLQVLEGVDAAPEPVVIMRHQLALLDQTLERLLDEFLAFPDVVEDLAAEDEIPAVDPGIGGNDVVDAEDGSVRRPRHEVEAVVGTNRQKGPDAVGALELLDELRQGKIAEPVAVVGEKHLLAGEERLDGLQPLADVRRDPRVNEGDAPVLDILAQQLDPARAVREHEIVRQALVVIQEIFLDGVALVAEAQDEVGVPEMSVVLHHVPEDGAIPEGHQRLWNFFGIIAQARAETTAEQDDFHSDLAPSRAAPTGGPESIGRAGGRPNRAIQREDGRIVPGRCRSTQRE